jgi:outer membrane protein OmpA-like peptidoglycan-associated protein
MRKFIYSFLAIGILTLNGCALNQMMKMAKDQNLTVDPDPLEVHADKVSFEVSANLPVKMLKPNLTYSLEMAYDYADKSAKFDEIKFTANEFPNRDTQQPRVSQKFEMPYDPEMNSGALTVVGYGINDKNGKKKGPTPKMEIAKGLITTSKMVVPAYYGAFVSYDYKDETVDGWTPDEELEPTNVNFYFMQGSSVLRNSEKKSDRGSFFQAFVAEKNVTRTVTITGTHSPEGSERINSDLSKNRAEVIEEYYRQMMDRYDYMGAAESIKFVLKPVVEDWTEFKAALEGYDGVDMAAKSEILNIVNGSGSFEDKEDALHKLPSYRKIFRDIYPDLRAAQTEILTVIKKRTDAEISILAKQIAAGKLPADTLSYGELAYAAYLTPSLKEKAAIYEATVKTYSNWAAHNNLAAVYIHMIKEGQGDATAHAEKAITQLEISLNKKNNAYAKGNMASAELAMGNAAKAYSAVTDAVGMNPPSKVLYGFNGTKGSMEVMMAKYPEAVKSLSSAMDDSDNMFNKGLAQLLAKDYQNALVTFNALYEKDGNYGKAAYGAAIANARLGKKEPAIGSIIDAIEADPSLKSMIASDLEFNAMMSDPQFIDAVK